MQLGPTYDDACKASLEQAASQSGLAGKFQHMTKQAERRAIRYLDPSHEAEIIFGVVGFAGKAVIDRRATFSVPNPFVKNSSLGITGGAEVFQINFRMDF
ncbi:MAG: hypothetical protein A4S09_05055 [Proteobacteria bacterium SG_bin7]|nr:MAG: hypothetical protein A4S09_05055 [Proteobacteria bacterium SG_bin7]